MVTMIFLTVALVGTTMAIAAIRTGNDPMIYGLLGLVLPVVAILLLPGLLRSSQRLTPEQWDERERVRAEEEYARTTLMPLTASLPLAMR